MKHKFLSLLVAIAASVGMMNAEVINGTCGESLTWSLNTTDSILIIQGTGDMQNYNTTTNPAPWLTYSSYIKNVFVHEGVTSIGNSAFVNCSNYEEVEIPNSVSRIGGSAFYGCGNLKAVHISNIANWCAIEFGASAANPLIYSKKLYLNGELVRNLVIPNGVTEIKAYAFKGCSVLTSIVLPNTITGIGTEAFNRCSGLTSIICAATTVPILGTDTWGSVDKSIPLYVPAQSMSTYSATAGWNEFTNLQSTYGSCGDNLNWYFDSPNSTLVIIGSGAMNDYSPDMVTLNTPWVSYCDQITSVSLPEGLTYIGGGALSKTKITNVVIPSTVNRIGIRAFNECSNLSSITIPDNSVTSISPYAFSGSKIASISIPNSVTYIGEGALWCSLLDTIYCNAVNPPTIDEWVFGWNPTSTPVILLPCSANLSAYQQDAQWSQYNVSYQSSYTYTVEVSENVEIRQQPTECNGNIAILYAKDSIVLRTEIGHNDYWVYGYQIFQSWEDGSTDKIRTAVITQDTSFTANYKTYSYLSFYVEGEGVIQIADTIAKSGWYDASSLTLTAVPAENYKFVEWIIREESGHLTIERGRTSENPLTINHEYGGYFYTALFSEVSSVIEHVKIGDLYYNLNAEDSTAEVTYDQQDCSCNYENLQDVTIPSSVTYNDLTYNVTSIGDGAFARCGTLSSVILPESVTHIGNYAFALCSNLESLTLNNNTTTAGENILGWEYYMMNIVIYVPCGTLEIYSNAEGWSEYRIHYAPSPYSITANESDHGYVDIPSYSICDDAIQVTAIAEEGYHFDQWSDGIKNNPRTVVLSQDVILTAEFVMDTADGIEDLYINGSTPNKVLIDGMLYIIKSDGHFYNVTGTKVK